MRFAGTRIEDFMSQGTDFGELSNKSAAMRSNDEVQGIKRASDTVNKGIGAAGEAKRAELSMAGQSSLASAQGQANTMSTIGGVISSGISALPSLGGGGASQVNFGSSDWTNTTAGFGNYAKSYL